MRCLARFAAVPCLTVSLTLVAAGVVLAQPNAKTNSNRSITDRSVARPTWDQWRRLLLLDDYNSRVVILSTTLLGCAAGMVGSFLKTGSSDFVQTLGDYRTCSGLFESDLEI